MKKVKISLCFLILIGLSSCNDYLSETPDNRTQIDSPKKITELLVGAYPNASYTEFTETMSDNVFDSKDFNAVTTNNTQNYNWEILGDIDSDTPSFYWDACYKAISQANQALDAIKKLGDTPDLNPQKGEALLARAYSHLMLVTLWSKTYNPSTAATDIGIPYVLEPETGLKVNYKRNTVAEVYNYIESDITEGLKYVSNDYKQPKFHFNKEAANALAARFYTLKGDWNKVLVYTNDLGSKPPLGAIRDYASYSSLNSTGIRTIYASVSQNTNLLIVSALSTHQRHYTIDRFGFADSRQGEVISAATNIFSKSWIYTLYQRGGTSILFVPKFQEYFSYTNINAGIGNAYCGFVLLSNDEAFLSRIEAHVMTNQMGLAASELGYFIGTRTSSYNPATDIVTDARIQTKYPVIPDEYTPFYTMTPLQTSYMKAIAEMRRRDFLHEGLRWFDIKRFNLVVKHQTNNQPDNILTKTDKRRELQIPAHALDNGVEMNPR